MMDIKTLLKMGVDGAVDWLIENEGDYDLVEKNNRGSYLFSYEFYGHFIYYNSAYELGEKCAEIRPSIPTGGNPFDPENTDFDCFALGVESVRNKQSSTK